MMLPQTLPDGAEIEVVYNDGSSDQTLTASIAGTDWGQGEMVVYRISHEDIVCEPTLKVYWLVSNWVSPQPDDQHQHLGQQLLDRVQGRAGDREFRPCALASGISGRVRELGED